MAQMLLHSTLNLDSSTKKPTWSHQEERPDVMSAGASDAEFAEIARASSIEIHTGRLVLCCNASTLLSPINPSTVPDAISEQNGTCPRVATTANMYRIVVYGACNSDCACCRPSEWIPLSQRTLVRLFQAWRMQCFTTPY